MTPLQKYIVRALEDQYPGPPTSHQKFYRHSIPKSDPEEKLAFDLKLSSLPAFDRNAQISGTPKAWAYDFVFRQERIILEVHGGVYTQGRHTRGAGFTEDRNKMNWATMLRWRVFEFTTEQVNNGECLEFVKELF